MSLIDKVVQVVFKGTDDVTPAANSAKSGVEGFVGGAGSALKALGALAAGLALGQYFKSAIEEAQKSRETMNALSNTVRNTGASWEDFAPQVDDAIAKLVRFSVYSDDDLAAALQSMILKTGDAGWSLKNLGQAADLAAAANIPLEQASAALAQAHEGNTRALFKMIPELKTASDWTSTLAAKTDGASAAQERARGPIAQVVKQWGEVTEAVGKAIMNNEELTGSGNGLADMLASLASWIETNGVAMTGMLGSAAQLAGTFSGLVAPSARILATALLALNTGVNEIWFHIQNLAAISEYAVGKMLVAFGTLVERGGKLLGVFGIKIVEGAGKQIRDTGADMVGSMQNVLLNLEVKYGQHEEQTKKTFRAIWTNVERIAKDGGAAMANAAQAGMKKTHDEVEAGASKVGGTVRAHLGPPLAASLAATSDALTALGQAAREQLPPDSARKFNEHMVSLAANAEQVRQRITAMKAPTDEASDATQKMALDVSGIARAALDAAQAFGVMDSKSAATLNTVVNLGQSIAKVAGGDMGSIPGIIAASASLISQMIGGDAARKKLIAENTVSMTRLRDELGNLRLNVTGEDFSKAQTALGGVVGQLRGGRGAQNQTDVVNALRAQGLSLSDLDKIANELGIRIKSDSGALSVDGLKQLFEAMSLVEIGKFGQDFSSQKEATLAGFGVNRTSELGQIGALGQLGASYSSALSGVVDTNDLAGTRDRLSAVFARLNAGGLSAQELGGLTGTQFLDFVTDLIGKIDALGGAVSSGTVPTLGSISIPDTSGISTVGVTSASVQEVLQGQTVAITDILSAHTDLHTRVASATEGTLTALLRVERLISKYSAGGGVDAIDQQLEETRYRLAVQRGAGASY